MDARSTSALNCDRVSGKGLISTITALRLVVGPESARLVIRSCDDGSQNGAFLALGHHLPDVRQSFDKVNYRCGSRFRERYVTSLEVNHIRSSTSLVMADSNMTVPVLRTTTTGSSSNISRRDQTIVLTNHRLDCIGYLACFLIDREQCLLPPSVSQNLRCIKEVRTMGRSIVSVEHMQNK